MVAAHQDHRTRSETRPTFQSTAMDATAVRSLLQVLRISPTMTGLFGLLVGDQS
jgi:hypothetical protein